MMIPDSLLLAVIQLQHPLIYLRVNILKEVIIIVIIIMNLKSDSDQRGAIALYITM